MSAIEEAARRIEAHAESAAWWVGRELLAVREERIWADGYRSLDAFVTVRLGRTMQWAYNHMRVAEAFTEAEVGAVGITRVIYILRVHPRRRAALLAEAPRMTKREIDERAKALNAEDGYAGESPHARAGSQSAKRKDGMRRALDAWAGARSGTVPDDQALALIAEAFEAGWRARGGDRKKVC